MPVDSAVSISVYVLPIVIPVTFGLFEKIPQRQIRKPLSFRALPDLAATLIFFLLACLFLLSLVDGNRPFTFLVTDSGNVASFVAGRMYPERFVDDLVLSDPRNYGFYVTIIIPVVMFLSSLVQHIGTAFVLLYLPLVFLQLLGFYFLGRHLFGSWSWAMLLALITLPKIDIFGGEIWGVYHEPLVRMSFGIVLPFLMYSFLRYGLQAQLLPWLFVLCGLSVYVYPVAAPTVALACWLAAFAFLSAVDQRRRYFIWLLFGGLISGVVAAPYAWFFFRGFPSLQLPSNLNAAMFGTQYANVAAAAKQILEVGGSGYAQYWIPGLAALFIVPSLSPQQKLAIRFLRLFIVGILLGSFGIAWLDQTVSRLLGRTPVQLDLVRNIRFEAPLLLLGFMWLLFETHVVLMAKSRRIPRVGARLLLGIGIVFTVALWRTWPNHFLSAIHFSAVASPPRVGREETDILLYLRQLPSGSRVLPLDAESVGLAVRYNALQPVVYLQKDANALVYSSSPKIADWKRDRDAIVALLAAKDPAAAAEQLRSLINLTRAQFLLFDRDHLSPVAATVAQAAGTQLLSTKSWQLIRISERGT